MTLIKSNIGLVGLEKTTVYLAMQDGTYQECSGYLATIDGVRIALHRNPGVHLWRMTDPSTGLALPWKGESRKAALDQITPDRLEAVRQALKSILARSQRAKLAEYLNAIAVAKLNREA